MRRILRQTTLALLLVLVLAACNGSPLLTQPTGSPDTRPETPPGSGSPATPRPWTSPGGGAIAIAPYGGQFVPAAIATDDGRLVVVAGSDKPEGEDVRAGIIAMSSDGGATFSTWQVGRVGPLIGISVRGSTIWLAARCGSSTCLLGSTDGGVSWDDLGLGKSVSPSLADPLRGIVLTPLIDGAATAMASGDGRTFAPVDLCGTGASPVSVSLDGLEGAVACRRDGDPAVDYDDDWWLLQRSGDAWLPLFAPPDATGPYDPDAPPSLSVSWVNRVVRRVGFGLLSTGAGYYRSTDDGHSWMRLNPDPASLPHGQWPDGEAIAADGTAIAVGSSLGGAWWILRSTTQGATWTTLYEAGF